MGAARIVVATAVITTAVVGVRLTNDGGGGPTQELNCFADPGACGYPDPDYGDVGVPAGTTLTNSGAITVNTPGTVIEALNITCSGTCITINADNVTIRNTRITGTGGGGLGAILIATCGGCDSTFDHIELLTTADPGYEHGIHKSPGSPGDANETVIGAYSPQGFDLHVWCEGVCSVTDSYLVAARPDGEGGWEPAADPEDHNENLYCNDCTFTVDHNTLFLPTPQTSVIFAQTANGSAAPCVNQLTITDNLIAGGGQMISFCAHNNGVGTHTATVTNNNFARCEEGNETAGGGGTWLCPSLFDHPGSDDGHGYYPNGGSFTLVNTYFAAVSTWSDNVWDDTGATIPEP